MNNRGFTLLEIMMTLAIMTVVMGVLFTMSISLGDTSRVQNLNITLHEEARRGLLLMIPELRQAALSSLSALPANNITYQIPQDLDGNGLAVDANGNMELSAARTIQRDDATDLNGDLVANTQVLRVIGTQWRVLANDLMADRDINGDGTVEPGLWFERVGTNRLMVTIRTEGQTRRGNRITATLSETVQMRN